MKSITKGKIVLGGVGILMIILGFDLTLSSIINSKNPVMGIIGIILLVGSFFFKDEKTDIIDEYLEKIKRKKP